MKKTFDEMMKTTMDEMDVPDIVDQKLEQTLSYLLEKEEENTINLHTYKRRKRYGKRMVAMVAIATMVLGGSVFAGVKLYQMKVEKEAAYKATVQMQSDESVAAITEETQLDELSVEVNYTPEGFVQSEKFSTGVENTDGDAGYGAGELFLIDKDASFTVLGSTEQESLMVGGRDALYIEEKHSTDKEWMFSHLYVLYPEYQRVQIFWAWGHASKDELIKIAENTDVKATGNKVNAEELQKWSDYSIGQDIDVSVVEGDEKHRQVSKNDVTVYEMNEDVPYAGMLPESEDATLNVKVKNISFSNENKDTLEYVNAGDGVNSLPEVVKSEERDVELVTADIEIQNITDEDMENVAFNFGLYEVVEDGDNLVLYNPAEGISEGYEYKNSSANWYEMDSYSIDGETLIKNYIPGIQAGESKIVQVSWMIDKADEDKLYMTMNQIGWFDEDANANGLIHLVK